MKKKITPAQLLKALTAEQKLRILQMDGDPTNLCRLEEFLKTNLTDPDVTHITISDAQSIIDLKLCEETYLPAGFGTTIKRVQ